MTAALRPGCPIGDGPVLTGLWKNAAERPLSRLPPLNDCLARLLATVLPRSGLPGSQRAPYPTAHKRHPRVFARAQALPRAGDGNAGDAIQPARARSRAPFRPPVLCRSDLINGCSAPVPDLLSSLFRARARPATGGLQVTATL